MDSLDQEIRSIIESSAEEFAAAVASSVLSVIRACTLEELAAVLDGAGGAPRRAAGTKGHRPRGQKSGKRVRRTMGDIMALVEMIAALVQKREGGATAEQIRTLLGVERKELPRALREGLKTKLLTKRGHKRATTYFAGAGAKAKSKKHVAPNKAHKGMNGAASAA
jgi:hypothetical protein